MDKDISLKQLLFSFFLFAALSACGSSSSDTSTSDTVSGTPVILKLQMQSKGTGKLKTLNASSISIASIEIDVTGDGKVLASKTAPVLPDELLIKMTLDILPGENRTVSVLARNADDELVSKGETTVDIAATGRDVPQVITVEMIAVPGPSNTPPVAGNETLSLTKDTPANGTLIATDADNDPLTFSIVTNGTLGTVVITNAATGAFTYTPNAGATGSDSFTFKANDGVTDSNIATVSVTITNPGIIVTGPIINPANGHRYFLLQADTWANSEAKALSLGGHLVTINDAAENDWVFDNFASVLAVPRALWIGFNDVAGEGNFVWASGEPVTFTNWGTSEPNNFGNEDFAVLQVLPMPTITGRQWNDVPVGVTNGIVEVNPANTPPVASNGALSLTRDIPANGTLVATDADGDPLTFSIVANGTLGTAVMTNAVTGAFTYTPNAGLSGSDGFIFKANDGTVDSNIATVNVTISAPAACALPPGFTKAWAAGDATDASDWSRAANWTPVDVPIATDNVFVCAALATQPRLTANVSVNNLTVEDGASLNLNGFTLTASGNVDGGNTITGAGTIQMTGTATTVQGSLPNLTVIRSTISFSAGTTVGGNLTVIGAGSRIDLNGQSVTVNGNFSVQDRSLLVMQNPTGQLTISGNALFQGEATGTLLTAGVINIKGNFTQQNGTFNRAATFSASGTHKVVFNGDAPQTVSFRSPNSTLSHFQEVVFANPIGVQFLTDVVAKGTADVTSGQVTEDVPHTATVGGDLLATVSNWGISNTTFTGDLPSIPSQFNNNVTIEGSVVFPLVTTISGNLRVTGAVSFSAGATVGGNLRVIGAGSRIDLNGQSVTVNGNFSVQDRGLLVMQNPTGQLTIAGDALFRGTGTKTFLTAGVINIKGNFTQQNGVFNGASPFAASGTHKVVFNGDALQTVSFQSPTSTGSHFQEVVFSNPIGVQFLSNVLVNGTADVTSGQVTEDVPHTATVGGDLLATVSNWHLSNTTFTGDLPSIPSQFNNNVTIEGSVVFPLVTTISGNLTVTGTVSFLAAATITGNLTVTGLGSRIDLNGQSAMVSGNFSVQNRGLLVMQNPTGQLTIAGNAVFRGTGTKTFLTAGVINIKGNFTQQNGVFNGASPFAASGTHKVVFNGDALQAVSFQSPNSTRSHFQEVVFANPIGVQILTDVFVNGQIISDVGLISKLLGPVNRNQTLTTAGVDMDGAVFDHLLFNINGNLITRFDNVTFQNYPSTVGQLFLNFSGVTQTFNGLKFLSVPGSGFYVVANGTSTITLANATPADGSAKTAVAGGFIVNWGANNAPIASGTGLQATKDIAVNSALIGFDADSDPLTFRIVANGALGTAVLTNLSPGSFTYTPNAGVTGIDSFTFVANDGKVDSNVATVNITIFQPSIVVSAASGAIAPFETFQSTAVVRLPNGANPFPGVPGSFFVWRSSDTAVATVDANGLVTGKTAGSAMVTATALGISGSANLTVALPSPHNLLVRVIGLIKETDPIPGVRVLLHHPTTGAFITERTTDINGIADFGDITLFGGITRATFTVKGAGLQTFINVLPEAYSVTLGPGEGSPVQATFDVQVSGAPASASTVNVTPGHFAGDAGDRSRNGDVAGGTATLIGTNAVALNSDGLFDLFAYVLDFTSNSALVGCEFRDGLDPVAFPGTVNLTVSGPPTSVPFISDIPVLTSMNFLRNGNVVEVFNQHPGAAGSLSGNIEFCDDPKITHYDVTVETPFPAPGVTRLSIDLIFDRLPTATDLNSIILPRLSIDTLVRDPATQVFSWTASGLDIAAIDLADMQITWDDPLIAGPIEWEIFVAPTDGSGTAVNPGGSFILPQLPVDPPGTADPFPAVPPATDVSFELGLIGIESPGIGTVGYNAAIELLNAKAFNPDKTLLTSTTQAIFAQRRGIGGALAANTQKLSAGGQHSCAVLPDGRVKCWGVGGGGQIGNGTRSNSLIPVFVSGITTATDVSAGGSHSCALLSDGRIQCWGSNASGTLGNGSTTTALTPVFVSGITTATAVSAGTAHSCALLLDGRVQCWGDNISGQLGNGTADSFIPVFVLGLTNATAISVGGRHSCALLLDGEIKCWGDNNFGTLGNGGSGQSNSPVFVSGITTATAVSTGTLHSCASLLDGSVQCWGAGIGGQLGGGLATNSRIPVPVNGISNAKAVSSESDHSCALLADGRIECWGGNFRGQLGNGTTTRSFIPVPVSGITTATAVSAGGALSCALLGDGRIQCWGQNGSGRLGDGTVTGSLTPVQVIGFTPPQQALSAGGDHTCGLLPDGRIKCWGQNSSRQLGNGGSTTPSTFPVFVSGISTATTVSAGTSHNCALLSDGRINCWGSNNLGELGNGSFTAIATPVFVSGMSTATAASAGADQSCALLSDGSIQCWGNNFVGQLGRPGISSATPVTVSGITNATAISAGGTASHTCALLSDGRVKCWGNNGRGQLGNGAITGSSSVPLLVNGISTATAVSVGVSHSCALLSDGRVQCWGDNSLGQLGNETTVDSLTPVLVSGITNATAISAGRNHNCALLAGGSIQCWGINSSSQLGNGTAIVIFSTPAPVSGIANAISVTAGENHTCALLLNGAAKCWGFGGFGQLGNGMRVAFSAPVNVSDFP